MIKVVFLLFFVILFSACQKQAETTSSQAKAPVDLYQKGKSVYMSNCIACHNTNPKLAGGVGPEVFGSSKELLEARILKAEYPQGYTPKRSTRMMQAHPHLRDDIEALQVFLSQ